MRFYIASHNRDYAWLLRKEIERIGHECTARWIVQDTKFGIGEYGDDERRRLALMDEDDVRRGTDGLILLAEMSGHLVPGGKHVETGMALAMGYPIYVVGRRENTFHWHPRVTVFNTISDLLAFLERNCDTAHSTSQVSEPAST